jgi:putative flippase GtrA
VRTAARQLLSFAAVGVVGFVVDAGALHLAITMLGTGLYLGRALSYLLAASCTWALNRRYTFRDRRGANRIAEWGRFLAANALGGLINYGTYALLVTFQPRVAANPVLGVAAGSIAGLAVNFLLSRYAVFRGTGNRT